MIVITGANGFIGKNLLKSFPKNQDIIAVDYSHNNLKQEIKQRKKHLYLLSPKDFLDMFRSGPCSISFVFHQGACTDTTCHDTAYMLERNYDYTYKLINLCVSSSTPLVYASSASVYGDGPFSETSQMNPKNIYAKSKSMIDDYVSVISQTTKSQITGLRYFNVYGPFEESKGKMSSVLNQFKKQIDTTGTIKIFENSQAYKRDFIFVNDIVKINKHFYESGHSGIFNCGTGQAERFTEIPRVLKKYYEFDIIEIPMPQTLIGKYQEFTESDTANLRGFGEYKEGFLSLEQGIEEYVKYWEKE
tara:strand:+ start:9942 stop:10850 length:909 start_codon:yes stop_codon:yes gene_type:complete